MPISTSVTTSRTADSFAVNSPSNAARSLRADDPVLAAIELTADACRRFAAGYAREPKDADGTAAVLTPAYARWRAAQDDICQDWDGAYTLMLATPPTTAAGAAALIGAFLQYERALGTELENVAPLLQTLLAFLEGCEADAQPTRNETLEAFGSSAGIAELVPCEGK
jgi:hypothetical protein